jgi:hypothetical protein
MFICVLTLHKALGETFKCIWRVHLISMSILLEKERRFYAYRHYTTLSLTPYNLHMFRFMITFASCFMMGNVHGCGVFPKCGVGVSHQLV